MKKRATSEETLEQKILKAQEKVARTAAAHEGAWMNYRYFWTSEMPNGRSKSGKQSSTAAEATRKSLG